jgi:hypothetical protein
MTTPRRLRRPAPKGDGWTVRTIEEMLWNRPYEPMPDVCCWRTNPLPPEVEESLIKAIQRHQEDQ